MSKKLTEKKYVRELLQSISMLINRNRILMLAHKDGYEILLTDLDRIENMSEGKLYKHILKSGCSVEIDNTGDEPIYEMYVPYKAVRHLLSRGFHSNEIFKACEIYKTKDKKC